MSRPLIVAMEAPEQHDDTDLESLANTINYRLGPTWLHVHVWDEDDFDQEIEDFGTVQEVVDLAVKREPRAS